MGTIVDIRSTLPADCFYGGWEQQGEALPGILAEEKELADSANARREEEARERAEREAYWAEREEWEAEHPVLGSIERICSEIYCSVWDFLEEMGGEIVFIFLFVLFFGPIIIIVPTYKIVVNIRRWYSLKMAYTTATAMQHPSRV